MDTDSQSILEYSDVCHVIGEFQGECNLNVNLDIATVICPPCSIAVQLT